MPKYNYHSLSSLEFEDLARDLIQARDKVILESFTSGKDSGIDFRYAHSKDDTMIVQVKRYKDDFRKLFNSLKTTEIPKLKKLNPSRYILVTSVGLTPANKEKLINLFGKWIIRTEDIIGRDDLDNLITLYPDIEEQNIKLWFSNVSVLKRILNSKVINQTEFEKVAIEKSVRVYVQNKSFGTAIDIVNKKNHVIISGQPGIGKTTLAHMIVYYFLGKGYDEFVYISSNIDEAYKLYQVNKKQVFLFDDFLGSNILDENLERNEDKRILSFISKVQGSKNKILILTTREYILEQAKYKYPVLGGKELIRSKVIIDLSEFNTLIKAKILFNHLFFSNIPEGHLKDLLLNEKYLSIINHKNYSPRVIDLALNELKIWEDIEPSKFYKSFAAILDDSSGLWRNIFEKKIDEISRIILVLIAISEQPILLADLRSALDTFLSVAGRENLLDLWENRFANAVRELHGTFIQTESDTKGNVAVEFNNPSVFDFLIEYLRERPDLLKKLFSGFSLSNQLFSIFEIPKRNQWATEIKPFKPIKIEGEMLAHFKTSIQNRLPSIRPNSKPYKSETSKSGFIWKKGDINEVSWLDQCIPIFDLEKDKMFRDLLLSRYSDINSNEIKLDGHFPSYVSLMFVLKPYVDIQVAPKIKFFATKAKTFHQIEAYSYFAQAFPSEFKRFIESANGKKVKEKAIPTMQKEFTRILFLALNSPVNDFWHRLIWKADMERVCEEINFISRCLQLPINLDSDYHKEYVRSKMREKDPDPENVKLSRDLEEEKVLQVVRDMFDSMRT